MKKLAFSALAAALALAACDNTPNDDVAATETGAAAGTDTTVVVPGPTATETTVVTTPGATATATATGDRVSVGPDGVTADVGDGDTRVRVDTNNPNLTVEKK
jgi:hypothetical protein